MSLTLYCVHRTTQTLLNDVSLYSDNLLFSPKFLRLGVLYILRELVSCESFLYLFKSFYCKILSCDTLKNYLMKSLEKIQVWF